jgi:hypothetical protein
VRPSPVLEGPGPPHRRGQGARALLRRLLLERLPAGRAQAVLPPVPALERAVTAQTRGRSGIRAVLGSSAMGTLEQSFPTHGGLQPCMVSGLCTRWPAAHPPRGAGKAPTAEETQAGEGQEVAVPSTGVMTSDAMIILGEAVPPHHWPSGIFCSIERERVAGLRGCG